MPNWCECELTVRGPRERVAALVAAVHSGEDENGEESHFDLNKIVPYPEEWARRDAEVEAWREHFMALPIEERRAYGPKDAHNIGGYQWCVERWGTKWNSCESRVSVSERGAVFTFSTAWAPPKPVILALAAQYPDLTLTLKYWEREVGFAGALRVRGERVLRNATRDYAGPRGG